MGRESVALLVPSKIYDPTINEHPPEDSVSDDIKHQQDKHRYPTRGVGEPCPNPSGVVPVEPTSDAIPGCNILCCDNNKSLTWIHLFSQEINAVYDRNCAISLINTALSSYLKTETYDAEPELLHIGGKQIILNTKTNVTLSHGSVRIDCPMWVCDLPANIPVIIGQDISRFIGLGEFGLEPIQPSIRKEATIDFEQFIDSADTEADVYLSEEILAATEEIIKTAKEENMAIKEGAICSLSEAVVHLQLRPDWKPWNYDNINSLSQSEKDAYQCRVDDLLSKGILKEIKNPKVWATLVQSPKYNDRGIQTGTRWSFGGNAAKRNTIHDDSEDRYVRIPDIIRELLDSTVMWKADLKDSYMHLWLSEEDQWITTIKAPDGKFYCFTRGTYGLVPAGAAMQKVSERVIAMADMSGPPARPYLDDTNKGDHDWKQSAENLRKFIETCTKVNLKLNFDKTKHSLSRTTIQGTLVGNQFKAAQPQKVQTIRDWPEPRTAKELGTFYGLLVWLHVFIPAFSVMGAQVSMLQRYKDLGHAWDDKCHKAFLLFKEIVSAQLKLWTPDYEKQFYVDTDASLYAIAGIIWQYADKEKRHKKIIDLFSKTLNKSQIKYPAIQRELLAIVFALEKFKHYLHERRFTLRTDAKALTYMDPNKAGNRMIDEWKHRLSKFDFDIHHLPGMLNVLPDQLSRVMNEVHSANFGRPVLPGDAELMPNYDPKRRKRRQQQRLKKKQKRSVSDSDTIDSYPAPILALVVLRGGKIIESSSHPVAGPEADDGNADVGVEVIPQDMMNEPPDVVQPEEQPIVEVNDNHDIVESSPAEDNPPIQFLQTAHNHTSITKRTIQQLADYEGLTCPESQQDRMDIIKAEHERGHFSSTDMVKQIRLAGYNWPGIVQNCIDAKGMCLECCYADSSKAGYHPARKNVYRLPRDAIEMDLAIMTTESAGFKYILVIVDLATKFVVLKNLSRKDESTMAETLSFIFSICGPPKEIRTDQGTEFFNKALKLMCDQRNIKYRASRVENHQSQGNVERYVGLAKNMLVKMLDNTENWHLMTPMVSHYLNRRIYKGRLSSPSSLFWGWPMNNYESYTNWNPSLLDDDTFENGMTLLHQFHTAALDGTAQLADANDEAMRQRLDENRPSIPANAFKVDTWCFKKRLDADGKSFGTPLYFGPFRCTGTDDMGNICLAHQDGSIHKHRVPPQQLKPVKVNFSTLDLDVYEVDSILDDTINNQNVVEYLVSWKGKSDAENSWEPISNLHNCNALIKKYIKSKKDNGGKREVVAIPAVGDMIASYLTFKPFFGLGKVTEVQSHDENANTKILVHWWGMKPGRTKEFQPMWTAPHTAQSLLSKKLTKSQIDKGYEPYISESLSRANIIIGGIELNPNGCLNGQDWNLIARRAQEFKRKVNAENDARMDSEPVF